MYGTVARIKPKAGQEQALIDLMNQWEKESRPATKGAIAGYTFKKVDDPSEWIIVAVFADKASYTANADSPAQGAWYQKFRALLDTDPVWEDGDIVQGTAP